ncbi:methyltransferase domain-containing protein [Candidatus Parcubacteria bacterium]|nr:MAG: methyltransferase domain-containing protein [Candidatus Parcubacteria bacterium]
MNPKVLVVQKIETFITPNKPFRILELGVGSTTPFEYLVKKYPLVEYVGVEPIGFGPKDSLKDFRKLANVKFFNQFGEERLRAYTAGYFDVCASFSVLEHVKNLEAFLKNSIDYVKTNGRIVHFYDRGHSMRPSSFRERLHVFFGNYLPFLLPAKKFVRHLDEKKVDNLIRKYGTEIEEITYHNMPDHKQFIKNLDRNDSLSKKLAADLSSWEFLVSKYVRAMPDDIRERFFLSVCFWAKKKIT